MREKPAYRDTLADILSFFDGKRVLTVTDVAKYTGHSRDWCRKTFSIDPSFGISATKLAHLLS